MSFLNYVVAMVVASVIGCFGGGILIPLFWNDHVGNSNSLANLGTFLGSIGTLGTLLFLIYQNSQIRLQQSKSNDDDEKKMDILLFQKYQMHRQEFEKLLDQIEEKYKKYKLNFHNRNQLYKDMFPENNFNKTEYYALNFMDATHATFDTFNKCLNRDDYDSNTILLLLEWFEIPFYGLHIRFNQGCTYGDVFNYKKEERTEFNIFEPNKKIAILNDVFSLISTFVFYERKVENRGCIKTLHIHFILDHCNIEGSYYGVSKWDDSALFQTLFEADKLLKDRASYGFGRPLYSFSIHQSILPCEVCRDLFTIDNLSKLDSDMEFKSVTINRFITSLNSGVKKSQSDSHKNKLSQKIASLRGFL